MKLGFDDGMTTPQGDEKLRDFFTRTADHWIVVAIQQMSPETTSPHTKVAGSLNVSKRSGKKGRVMNGKELRRAAFVECERRYFLLRPLVEKIYVYEKEQLLMESAASHAGTLQHEKSPKRKKEKKEKKKKEKKEKKEKKKKKDRDSS